MHSVLPQWAGLSREGNRGSLYRWSRLIIFPTTVYLVSAVLVFGIWNVTGDVRWVETFFQVPGAFLIVFLAGVQLVLGFRAFLHFAPGETLREAWRLITLSAWFDLLGSVCIQILGSPRLTPFRWWPQVFISWIHYAGVNLQGPLRFAILAAGLSGILKTYHRLGLLARLRIFDMALLAILAIYIVRSFVDLAGFLHAGLRPGLAEILNWPVDPLLWILLVEALLLYRTTQSTGRGWITNCYRALCAAIFLTVLGDIGNWAGHYGYVRWPWYSVTWCLWVPAEACFALAPANQLEAIDRASGEL